MKSFCFIFCLLIQAVFLNAAIPEFVYDGSGEDIKGEFIGIYEDPSGELSIDDAVDINEYNVSNQNVPNLMISESVFWAKINFTNNSDDEILLLKYDYPIIKRANMYIVDPEGEVTVQKLGAKVPITERKFERSGFIYDLIIPKGESRTLFLEIKSDQQIMLPLKVGSKETIYGYTTNKNTYLGIYCGVIFAMFLYNLFLSFSTKDRSYLLYSIYIIFLGLTHLSIHGFSYEIFWPWSPKLAEWSVALSPALVGITGIHFISDFLKTKENAKKLHASFYIVYAVYVVCIFLFFFGFEQISYKISQGIVLALVTIIVSTSIILIRKGYRPAMFFLAAWSIFLICVAIFILKDFGIVPYNTFTTHSMEIGASIELVLISFALADRINILKKEKEESQERELNLLYEKREIIEEQNIVLEQKVEERTEELQATNLDLNKAITELKQTQSQLVDAEKMASLGQLTAGIAHEINNPINFVVSNIKPLKRDIDDVLEVLEAYANIDHKADVHAQMKEIEELKEDLDLDYTIDEIEMLLKGIDEGAGRTVEIVKSLRTFSRLDENDLKEADINECLDSTILLLKNDIKGKIEIEKDFEDLPRYECFPGKLNQLFMNLLNNAIHAINAKEYADNQKPLINLRTKTIDKELIINIKDNGIGMEKEVLEHIFEPFFTTKDVGEGTGLGLSIVYNIIEKHKAKVDVKSEPDVGTEFTITLPTQIDFDKGAQNEKDKYKDNRRERMLGDRSSVK